jgi:hypothetical protein
MTVYPVIAYRFGQREKHSYLVGVYSTIEMATDAVEFEKEERAGKYACEIIEVPMDDDYNVLDYFKIIRELPRPDGLTVEN